MAITKLFCAFHEAHHLKMLPTFGEYKERLLYNLKACIDSGAFVEYYDYDFNFVQNVRDRINSMDEQDSLLDELFADAGSLDVIAFVVNHLNIFEPRWNLKKFALATKKMIENFYAFNTLKYELLLSRKKLGKMDQVC